MRRVSEARYSLIGDFPSAVSVSSFALSPTSPLLYFITESWREIGDTVGGDWAGLHRFNLDTRQCDILTCPGELTLPSPYRRGWLVELLSAAQDGCTLFCRAGLEREHGVVEYYLSELSVLNSRVTTIARLEHAFA